MRTKVHFETKIVDPSHSPPKRTAGKSVYGASFLPPDVSELVYKTCTLATAKPAAVRLLASSMRKIYVQVQSLCEDGKETKSGTGHGEAAVCTTDVTTLTPIEPLSSPTMTARLAYLSKAAEESGVDKSFGELIGTSSVEMIHGVSLQTATQLECVNSNEKASSALLEFESAEALGGTLTMLESDEIVAEDSPIVERDKEVELIFEDVEEAKWAEEVVGHQIEVFSLKDQLWCIAYVSSEDPDGQHVLVYSDGEVESVELKTHLWRPLW